MAAPDLSRICLGFVQDLFSPEKQNFKIWQGATEVSIWPYRICPGFVQDLSRICPVLKREISNSGRGPQRSRSDRTGFVQDLSVICFGFVQDLFSLETQNFKIWQGATEVSIWPHRICLGFVWDLSRICLVLKSKISKFGREPQRSRYGRTGFVQDLSRICPGFVQS